MTDLENKCAYFMSSTSKEGNKENPSFCKDCAGAYRQCPNYMAPAPEDLFKHIEKLSVEYHGED